MEPLVSVIVPAYNAEKNLERCILSLKNQTLDDFEVIFVDDGSSDGTPALARSLTEGDSRFKLLSQHNSGPGEARNRGISAARGKYLAFLDSDDYFETDAISKLVEAAERTNADIAVCGFITEKITPSGSTRHKKLPFASLSKGILTQEDINSHFAELYSNSFFNPLWAKLYRSSLIKENNIRLRSDLPLGEDLLFNYEVFEKASFFCCVPEYLYHYVWDENAPTLSKRQGTEMLSVQLLLHRESMKQLKKRKIDTPENTGFLYRDFYRWVYSCALDILLGPSPFKIKISSLKAIENTPEVLRCAKFVSSGEGSGLNRKQVLLCRLIKLKLLATLALFGKILQILKNGEEK